MSAICPAAGRLSSLGGARLPGYPGVCADVAELADALDLGSDQTMKIYHKIQ
jgi:hypothetical protein